MVHCSSFSSRLTGPDCHAILSHSSAASNSNLLQRACVTPAFRCCAIATPTGGHYNTHRKWHWLLKTFLSTGSCVLFQPFSQCLAAVWDLRSTGSCKYCKRWTSFRPICPDATPGSTATSKFLKIHKLKYPKNKNIRRCVFFIKNLGNFTFFFYIETVNGSFNR